MRETVRMAARRGVAIGAHPSYPDIPGFGRRELGLPPEEISRHVAYQIRSLQDVCTRENAKLIHVKPHGALYNRAARDPGAADAIASAIREVDAGLLLLGLAASEMMRAARRADITFVSEAFADRAYRSDGTLVPRGEPGAVLGDADLVVSRAVRLVMENTIVAEDGVELRIEARSLCVHGDNPQAETILGALRAGLERAGVKIAPFST